MARTSASTKKTTVAKTAETAPVEEAAVQTVKQEAAKPAAKAPAYKVIEEIDPNMYVPVRNGFNGKLIYKSRKTGERYVWNEFGDEQDMELRELRAAKTSYKKFFENNWFLIDDPAVIEYLGVERYYKDALTYDEFDTLFDESPATITKRVEGLSDGQKASLKYRARQLIRDGGIDSISKINALEKALGVSLIER